MKDLKNIFLIFLLWLSPTAVFLLFYQAYNINNKVLFDHALLMFSAASVFIFLSLVANHVFEQNAIKIARLFFPIPWFSVVLFSYSVMAVGLISWGRIPTYKILSTYVIQFEKAISVINLSKWIVLGLILLFCCIVFIFSALSAKLQKALSASHEKNKHFLLTRFLFLTLGLAFFVNNLTHKVIYNTKSQEPWLQIFNNTQAKSEKTVLLETLGQHSDNRLVVQEHQVKEAYQIAQKKRVPSVILITVDALRPDRMGIYGASRQTTPYLQRMKNQGIAHAIDEARSACAESTCGLLSLLSGKEPQQLIANNFGLPDILGKLGYKRYALLSGDHSNYYGLKESYGTFDVYWDGTFNPIKYVNDDFSLLDRIRELPFASKETNYFFFIHMMSVHGLGLKYSKFEAWQPSQSIYKYSSDLNKNLDAYQNNYDNGILQADFLIHEIYSSLKTKGYIHEDSIILITADHGESLGEHGIRSHAESLYDSVIRIPWIWIGNPLGNTAHPVIQADFAPTVLKEIGSPIPIHWKGLPLQNGSSNRKYTLHAQFPLAAVISYSAAERKKLIIDIRNNKKLFFDLKEDQREAKNIMQENKELEKIIENAGFSFFKVF